MKLQKTENSLLSQWVLFKFLVKIFHKNSLDCGQYFNFAVRFLINTLVNRSNMVLSGQTDDFQCNFCKEHEIVEHGLVGCKGYFDEDLCP